MDPQASIFGDFSELCANCCVEKGYTTTNLAAERVKEGIVTGASRAPEGFVVAFRREFDGVTKSECAADLKFPVIEIKSGLLGG